MTSLALVQPDNTAWMSALKALVLDSVSSPHSRTAYGRALDDFFAWWNGVGPFSKALVNAWRKSLEEQGYSGASINQKLTAVRKLANEGADNNLLPATTAASVCRVKGAKQLGVRSGNWLTSEQTQKTLFAPDVTTLQGMRDRALLAVLFGCGLRRSEACALTFGHIAQREGRWVIVDLVGKGGRVRTVPMPAWVKVAIDRWTAAAGISDGTIFRAIRRGGHIWGGGLTPKVIRQIVMRHAPVERFSAHDARRTFAKLCRDASAPLEQIQLLLGHASIQTTERYLGSRLSIQDAANDALKLSA